MGKISNVITMLKLLSNGRKYSIKELSEILEVTPRMVRFYKEELEKSNIFIDTIKGPSGGYILNQKLYLPKEDKKTQIEMSEFDKNIYNIIIKALKEKRKVKITYFSNDQSTERIIHPIDLYIYNNSWYIPAYCELRKYLRHFEFNKIKSIEILNDFFK